jgi:hypothetical protein
MYPPISPIIPVGSVNPVSGVPCCAARPDKPVAVPEADSAFMLAISSLLIAAASYRAACLHKSR